MVDADSASTLDAGANEAERAALRLNTQNLTAVMRDSTPSDRLGYLYLPIGKAANTATKRLLWRAEMARGYEVPLPKRDFGVHNDGWRLGRDVPSPWHNYQPAERGRFLAESFAPDRFVFTVVRNPFTRLLSAYLDRVRKMIAAHGGTKLMGLPRVPDDFADFARMACTQPDQQRNLHWRSQAVVLRQPHFPLRFVAHMETLDSDYRLILERLGAPELAETAGREKLAHTISAADKLHACYTDELVELVAGAYAEDFERFGYAPTPETISPDKARCAAATNAPLAAVPDSYWSADVAPARLLPRPFIARLGELIEAENRRQAATARSGVPA